MKRGAGFQRGIAASTAWVAVLASLLGVGGGPLALGAAGPPPALATLALAVGPVRPDALRRLGVLRAYLCDSPLCYQNRGTGRHRYLLEAVSAVSASTIRLEFRDLRPGAYSVFVHHDRDNDGRVTAVTCGVLGKPVDGIGWSRNVDPRRNWGEPAWAQVMVALAPGETMSLDIHPIYMCD